MTQFSFFVFNFQVPIGMDFDSHMDSPIQEQPQRRRRLLKQKDVRHLWSTFEFLKKIKIEK